MSIVHSFPSMTTLMRSFSEETSIGGLILSSASFASPGLSVGFKTGLVSFSLTALPRSNLHTTHQNRSSNIRGDYDITILLVPCDGNRIINDILDFISMGYDKHLIK